MSWIHFYIDEYRCFNGTESSDEVLSVEHGMERGPEKRPNTWESSAADVEYVEGYGDGDKEVNYVCTSSDEAEGDSVDEGTEDSLSSSANAEEFDGDNDNADEIEKITKEKREDSSDQKLKNKCINEEALIKAKEDDKRDEWWKSQLEEPYDCTIS